jgi:agmatine/peptidylarginine deiminase
MKRILTLTTTLFLTIIVNAQLSNPRVPAEWERAQGILISFPTPQPPDIFKTDSIIYSTLANIAQLSLLEGIDVYVLDTIAGIATDFLSDFGININDPKLHIINYSFDDYIYGVTPWMRDKGPFSIYDNEVEALHFGIWTDDDGARVLNTLLNYPEVNLTVPTVPTPEKYFYCDGGNYLTDGQGNVFLDLSYFNIPGGPSINDTSSIHSQMRTSMGAKQIRLNSTDFIHSDYYLKLIDEETFMIAGFPDDVDYPELPHHSIDPQIIIDEIQQNYLSCYGRPYEFIVVDNAPFVQIFDIDNPLGLFNMDFGGNYCSYTNAQIINGTVMVPQYNLVVGGVDYQTAIARDAAAMDAYEEHMPGYNIVGVNAVYWGGLSSGSVHCLSREIAEDEPVWIRHKWLDDTVYNNGLPYEIMATIKTSSGVDNAVVYWRTDPSGNFTPIVMENVAGDLFSASIPVQPIGETVHYYIEASSNSGKVEKKPLVAPDWAYNFFVDLGTNLEEFDKIHEGNISIYPNPAKDFIGFYIDYWIYNNYSIQIYSIFGQQIKSDIISQYSNIIDVSEFTNGQYIYRILGSNNEPLKSGIFIIQR